MAPATPGFLDGAPLRVLVGEGGEADISPTRMAR